jgi:hypothetical protein
MPDDPLLDEVPEDAAFHAVGYEYDGIALVGGSVANGRPADGNVADAVMVWYGATFSWCTWMVLPLATVVVHGGAADSEQDFSVAAAGAVIVAFTDNIGTSQLPSTKSQSREASVPATVTAAGTS